MRCSRPYMSWERGKHVADTVFLHGWGISGVVWSETVALLPADFSCSTPDLPGYGDTATLSPYSAESLADALAEQIAAPVDLVGWSMGGMAALALAARHPDSRHPPAYRPAGYGAPAHLAVRRAYAGGCGCTARGPA